MNVILHKNDELGIKPAYMDDGSIGVIVKSKMKTPPIGSVVQRVDDSLIQIGKSSAYSSLIKTIDIDVRISLLSSGDMLELEPEA